MLNTVMALWNQHPGENRQRVVKLLFTFLFISVSIFLLLFTLNSSAWSSATGQEQIQTKKEGQMGMRKHTEVATATTAPASADVVAGIAPAATRIPIQLCVYTPIVVVQPRVAPPQSVLYASRNRALNHKSSKARPVHPGTIHVKKDKPHPRKRPNVKAIAASAPQKIIIVMPSPSPVPVTPSPTVTPVVTALATQTPVPTEGTVVSSGMPDIVISTATPDTSMVATNSFAHSLRKKEAMRIPVSSTSKSTKKSTTKNRNRVHKEVECSRSTTYKDDSEGTIVKAKRHAGLLLGSSLLGTLLLCCFVLTRRREK
jgi:hypothetical protein